MLFVLKQHYIIPIFFYQNYHLFLSKFSNLHKKKNQSIIGPWTEEYLDKIHVDVCISGTSGLLNSNGPTSHSYQELAVRKKMIEKSNYVFVVADSSKFQEKGLHLVCDWKMIDGVITDHPLSMDIFEKMNKKFWFTLKKNKKYQK